MDSKLESVCIVSMSKAQSHLIDDGETELNQDDGGWNCLTVTQWLLPPDQGCINKTALAYKGAKNWKKYEQTLKFDNMVEWMLGMLLYVVVCCMLLRVCNFCQFLNRKDEK